MSLPRLKEGKNVRPRQYLLECTEAEKMARTLFGEIPFCCFLTVLLGPAWVLHRYVLQTIFSGPVLVRYFQGSEERVPTVPSPQNYVHLVIIAIAGMALMLRMC